MPAIPDAHALVCLLLTAAALALFARDRVPLEATGLGVLVALSIGFHVFPYEVDGERLDPRIFFAGFGNVALITIVALLVCAKGLETTGSLQPVAHWLANRWRRAPRRSFLATLLLTAGLSMFVNNTPLVSMLLPILVAVCMRTGISASGVLMPVGYATILGGMTTTIGTSTNLLVAGLVVEHGLAPFGVFHFFVPAAVAAGIGVAFLWLLAPRLIPTRTPPMPDTSPRVFRAVLRVEEGSYPAGRSLMELLTHTGGRLRIRDVERGEELRLVRLPGLRFRPGDRIHVIDTPDNLKELERLLRTPLYAGSDLSQRFEPGATPEAGGQRLAEVVVLPGSELDGEPLDPEEFLQRHRLLALAVHQSGREAISGSVLARRPVLRGGDVVLVQGTRTQLLDVKRGGRLLVLDGHTDLPQTRKSKLSLAIGVAVVLAASLGLLPMAVSAVCGAAAMLFSGCLGWEQLRAALDRRLIVVIAASLALGQSLYLTGATDWLAQWFLASVGGFPVALVLAALLFTWSLLTEFVTNNAAAVLGTPIAIAIAHQLGVDPEPFVLAVLFGSNMSYLTPMGYQTNLLVLTVGGYRFLDFFRVGIPLQLIVWLSLSLTLPLFYDLTPHR